MNVLAFVVVLGVVYHLVVRTARKEKASRNAWGAFGLVCYGLVLLALAYFQFFLR